MSEPLKPGEILYLSYINVSPVFYSLSLIITSLHSQSHHYKHTSYRVASPVLDNQNKNQLPENTKFQDWQTLIADHRGTGTGNGVGVGVGEGVRSSGGNSGVGDVITGVIVG